MERMIRDNSPGIEMAPLTNIIGQKNDHGVCALIIGVSGKALASLITGKTKHGGLFLCDEAEYKSAFETLRKEAEDRLTISSVAIDGLFEFFKSKSRSDLCIGLKSFLIDYAAMAEAVYEENEALKKQIESYKPSAQ